MLHQKENENHTQVRIKPKVFCLRLIVRPVIFKSLRSIKFLGIIGISFASISSSEAIKLVNKMNNIPPLNGTARSVAAIGANININVKNGNPCEKR